MIGFHNSYCGRIQNPWEKNSWNVSHQLFGRHLKNISRNVSWKVVDIFFRIYSAKVFRNFKNYSWKLFHEILIKRFINVSYISRMVSWIVLEIFFRIFSSKLCTNFKNLSWILFYETFRKHFFIVSLKIFGKVFEPLLE